MWLLLACASAPFPGPAVAPELPGPYAVGATTESWTDDRGRAMVAEVWYPAAPDADAEPEPYPELPFVGTAFRDAEPLPGPWPLVAFSHGYGGIRYQSIFFTEWLAGHGFVVVAPDHTYNTLLDLDDSRDAEVLANRPGDVASAVDRAQAEFDVEGTDYVVTGHSFGAWTATAVGGGVIDIDGMRTLCAQYGGALCGLDLPDEIDVPDAPDPRAIAAVPMAPCGWYSFGEHGLDAASPMLVMAGDRDDTCPLETEAQPQYDRLPDPRALATVHGGGHYVFSDMCRLGPLVSECTEEGYVDTARAQVGIRALATAWVMRAYGADVTLRSVDDVGVAEGGG